MLRLEGKPGVRRVLESRLPRWDRSKSRARVELDARLCGEDLEDTPRARIEQPSGEVRLVRHAVIENEVVIVPASDEHLLMRVSNPTANPLRAGEVERCSGDRLDLAGRNQRGI